MNIASALLLMCVICALIGIYRALENEREEQRRKNLLTAKALDPQRLYRGARELQRINETELKRLIGESPEPVIFCLVDTGPSKTIPRRFPAELVVTLRQFEERVSWIPSGSRVVVYRTGEIDAPLEKRISALTSGREVYLLSGKSPSMATSPNEMAGARCS
jgi:hypothetical protein